MATATEEEAQLFIEHNQDCEGLLEWIIELLPQAAFNGYVADIKEMKGAG
jgi:hypothetical protein